MATQQKSAKTKAAKVEIKNEVRGAAKAQRKTNGTIDAAYKHWILGQDAAPRQPRWSIVRDVLHWME